MARARYGLTLERKRRLAMDLKQLHTRISNVCDELFRAYPAPNGQVKMLLGQLEKASGHLREARSFAERSLVVSISTGGKEPPTVFDQLELFEDGKVVNVHLKGL